MVGEDSILPGDEPLSEANDHGGRRFLYINIKKRLKSEACIVMECMTCASPTTAQLHESVRKSLSEEYRGDRLIGILGRLVISTPAK